ncbi:MAG TPA: pentapeptide repeat-containing protein [Segetibacter sp.]|jgi:uncharacterized protein YjbI with pentapeptide repeats
MNNVYIEDKSFERIDYTEKELTKAEYDNCTFTDCDFSNADLSGMAFSECEFSGCNLSNVKTIKTSFRDVQFEDSKLLGIHFENCDDFLFSVSFTNCILNLSSFYKLKIKKTTFKNCSLHEVDFTEADLTGSVFETCDLLMAAFENTILEKADLRTAFNYSIDPTINKIKKAMFSKAGITGLLDKLDIKIDD